MADALSCVVRCVDVEIDFRQECVRRGGVEQRLRQKTFQVLVYLIVHRERLVSKLELFDAIWSGVAVTEDTLVQSIVEIRKALGDDPRAPRFIRTVPKAGYRFVASIDEEPASATSVEYETVRHVEIELSEDDGERRPASRMRPVWMVAAAVVVLLVGCLELVRVRSLFASVDAPRRPPSSLMNSTSADVADAMTDNLVAYEEYTTGVTLAQQFHDDKAIAAFQRAVALDPHFAMAYARIGYVYGVTSTFPDRGRPYLERALALRARMSEKDRYYVEAWRAIVDARYAAAIDIFRLLLTRYPTEVEAQCHLGLLLESEGRLDQAVAALEHARLVEPAAAQVHNILGNLYRAQHRFGDALAMHQRAVALAPDEANVHDSLGLSWQAAGNYENALREYDAALRLDAAFEIARIHRGNTLYSMGRYREALVEFQEVVKRGTSGFERGRGYASQAWILRSRGDLAAAEQEARRAVAADAGANPTLLVVVADRGDLTAAHQLRNTYDATLHQGRGARASLRFVYFYNGYEALKSGRTNESVDLLRRALQYEAPIFSIDSFDDCLAAAFFSIGHYDDAAREYERVIAADPQHALARFQLANTYDRLGRRVDAAREYRRFLEVWNRADDDLPQIVAARKRLSALAAS